MNMAFLENKMPLSKEKILPPTHSLRETIG